MEHLHVSSNFSAPFIRRPVATSLITVAILLSGVVAFRFLPVAPLPQVDFPTISVGANLPGASHGYRACARPVRANRDGREIHLRKRRDGQEAESDDAGKQNGDGDQRRSYRPSDKGRREIGRDMQVFHLISGRRLLNGIADVKLEAAAKPVKSEVDDRGGIEGQQLAENQAANDGDAEWTAQLGTDAGSERKRQTAEQRGHRGHHDGPETQQAGFVNGVERRLAFLAFSFEREVNHHDGVFLDDADQQDDANERDDAKFRATKQEGKDGADSGGRKRGKNRNRMDVAFVQNAENNVNGDDRSQYQDGLIGKRPEEGGRGAL